MLKSILLFIKAHAVATTIMATVVVGAAVATPIIVSDYMLDKNVRDNLSMLAPSNFQLDTDNQIIENNQAQSENEPLTFSIERVETNYENGNKEISYKIVPSYDKDISRWTKAEKKAYLAMEKEANQLIQEEHNKLVANEEKSMQDAINEIPTILAAQSKTYSFNCIEDDGSHVGELWCYNHYQKAYSGATIYYEGEVPMIPGGVGVTIENFRTMVYPILKNKMEKYKNEEIERRATDGQNEIIKEIEAYYKEELEKLEELYHLSD